MNKKELQEKLSQYPDEARIVSFIGHIDIYYEDENDILHTDTIDMRRKLILTQTKVIKGEDINQKINDYTTDKFINDPLKGGK